MNVRQMIGELSYAELPVDFEAGVLARIESLREKPIRQLAIRTRMKPVWPAMVSSAAGFAGFGLYLFVAGVPIVNVVSPALRNLASLL